MRFRNTTFAAGLPFTGKSHGVVLGDLFGDGRLSILVGGRRRLSGRPADHGGVLSEDASGNYVNVRLTGVKSNRSAIGAQNLGGSGRTEAISRGRRREQFRMYAIRATFRPG